MIDLAQEQPDVLLGPLAIGDVEHDHDHADDIAVAVPLWLADDRIMAGFAGRADDRRPVQLAGDALAGERSIQEGRDLFGVNWRQKVGRVLADDVMWQAENFAVGRIGEYIAAVAVQGDEPDAGIVGGRLKQGRARAQSVRALGHALLERTVQLAQLLLGSAPLGHFGEQGAVGHASISRCMRCSSAKTATFERRMAGLTGLCR